MFTVLTARTGIETAKTTRWDSRQILYDSAVEVNCYQCYA